MDPLQQEISERDQLWASLRVLLTDIDLLAQGQYDGSARQQQIVTLLAKIVASELDFRHRHAESD